MNTRIRKLTRILIFGLVTFVFPAAAFAQVLKLPLGPAGTWTKDPGEINQACSPPNPFELSFVDFASVGLRGDGVALKGQSNSVACCTCTRRTKSFPLGAVLNTNGWRLVGDFYADRGPNDPYSLASMQIDLFRSGSRVAQAVFAGENRPNNNCAQPGPAIILPTAGDFTILLSSISPNTQFDQITIHLQSYACGMASNMVILNELVLTTLSSPPPPGSGPPTLGPPTLAFGALNLATPGPSPLFGPVVTPGVIPPTFQLHLYKSTGSLTNGFFGPSYPGVEIQVKTSPPLKNSSLGFANVVGILEDPGRPGTGWENFFQIFRNRLQTFRTDSAGVLTIRIDKAELFSALQYVDTAHYPSGRMHFIITLPGGSKLEFKVNVGVS